MLMWLTSVEIAKSLHQVRKAHYKLGSVLGLVLLGSVKLVCRLSQVVWLAKLWFYIGDWVQSVGFNS